MDPVQQVLAQQQSGSAEGQGFAQFAVEGMRLGQQQQQLNLANRRLEMAEKEQDMLLPLQRQMLGAQVANLGIQGETAKLQLLNLTQQNMAMPELLSLQLRFAQSPEGHLDPQGLADYERLFLKYPIAFAGGIGAEINDSIQAAMKFKMGMQHFKQAAQQVSQFGVVPTQMDPKTGMVSGFAKADRSIPEDQRMQLARQHGLEVSGVDDQGRASFARPTTGEITEIDPTTGRVTITRGGKGVDPSGLTPTQRGTATLQATKLEDVSRRLDDIITQADDIFGPAAAAQNVVVDQFLANFNPRLAKGERIQGRSKASLVLEGLLVQLGEGQGQLSNKDIERLKGAFPELKNPKEVLFENPENARQILRAIQKELTRDAYVKAQQVKQPPSKEVLRRLSPAFLGEELKAGRISQDQFIEAINNSVHVDEVNALLDSR